MNCRCAALGLSLLGCLALIPPAQCATAKPLPLQLKFIAAPSMHASRPNMTAGSRAAFHAAADEHRAPRFVQISPPTLRQRALQSVLEDGDIDDQATMGSPQSAASFRFERQGSAFRDLNRSYKAMCANVSGKIWDEPNGRRIKFDSAGKPGVAVVIPIR